MSAKNSAPERVKPQPLAEESVDDLWRMRQAARDDEDTAQGARHAVEDELFRRFAETGASRMILSSGLPIDISYASPGWDVPALIAFGAELIERAMIKEEDWRLIVSWAPKVNGTRLKGLRKLGHDIDQRIDACQIASTGRPILKGPTLKEMEA